jgi:hypothetical protein
MEREINTKCWFLNKRRVHLSADGRIILKWVLTAQEDLAPYSQ